jgi:hypothetical protein
LSSVSGMRVTGLRSQPPGGEDSDRCERRSCERGRRTAGARGDSGDDEHELDTFEQHALERDEAAGPVGLAGRRQRRVVQCLLGFHELGQRRRARPLSCEAQRALAKPLEDIERLVLAAVDVRA